MKYKTGDFTLIKFDEVGCKIDTKVFKNYTTAKSVLDIYKKENKNCSGVISRVIYNSSFNQDKWGYKNDM